MLKKIVSFIVFTLLLGYLAFAVVALCSRPAGQECKGVWLEMRDSVESGYMTTQDIMDLLKKVNLDPTGRQIDDVSLKAIEEGVGQSPLIRNCECYKTIDGYVVVNVKCRRPILRVMPMDGDSYYLDEEGEVVERIAKAVYLPLATGYIKREFAQEKLLPLAQYLCEHELWNAQIAQICVTSRGEIELIPRIGDHVIVLGRPGDYEAKFDKLQTFYEKGLGELGWNRYSRINVDYENQVVATKK